MDKLNKRTLFVGGRFDCEGGKSSGYFRKLVKEAQKYITASDTVNGGSLTELVGAFHLIRSYDVIIWAPDVPNEEEKFVGHIKQTHPKKLLVTSKRNLTEDSYTFQDIVTRALATKSNLVLELSGSRERVLGTILDPLGVVYCHEEADVGVVAGALVRRLQRLTEFTRVPSVQLGVSLPVPRAAEFFQLVREQAETFHEIIHGVNHTRMMGNASFRCARGFPSYRHLEGIFVSRRNIDKRFVGHEDFVYARLAAGGVVGYTGSRKPSVDTPIQLLLYEALPNINYMLHSHTYIKGAPFTKEPVPCGALEEAKMVLDILLFRYGNLHLSYAINLLGHGSIVMGGTVDDLRGVPWMPRPIPEIL